MPSRSVGHSARGRKAESWPDQGQRAHVTVPSIASNRRFGSSNSMSFDALLLPRTPSGQLVDVDADLLGVQRVHRVLGIDERAHTTELLSLASDFLAPWPRETLAPTGFELMPSPLEPDWEALAGEPVHDLCICADTNVSDREPSHAKPRVARQAGPYK